MGHPSTTNDIARGIYPGAVRVWKSAAECECGVWAFIYPSLSAVGDMDKTMLLEYCCICIVQRDAV